MLRLFNLTLQGVYIALFLSNILSVTVCYGCANDNDVISEQGLVYTKQQINVRSIPDHKNKCGEKLGILPKNAPIEVSYRTAKTSTIDSKTAYWYKIDFYGKDGWIFGGYVEQVSLNSNKEQCFRTFAGSWRYLNNISQGVTDESVVAHLKEMRDESLNLSLSVIPKNKETETPYKEWLKERENDIVALKKEVSEIPVKSVNDVYMIPVKINGKISLDFILDTLNDDVIIPRRVFDELDDEIKLSDSKIELPASLDETCSTETEGHVYLELEVNGHKVDHKCLIVNYDCCIDYDMCTNADTPRLGLSFLRKLGNFSLLFSSQ